jgi:hypothetical protein
MTWRDDINYQSAKTKCLDKLRHAIEQVEKDQHLNAQFAMTSALRNSMRCFGVIRHPPERANSPASPEEINALRVASPRTPKRWTYDEYIALPEADKETGACPNCDGQHYGSIHVQRELPSVYRCHGTEAHNEEDFVPSCGTLFRGRLGDHFDAEWYAVESIGVFIARAGSSAEDTP